MRLTAMQSVRDPKQPGKWRGRIVIHWLSGSTDVELCPHRHGSKKLADKCTDRSISENEQRTNDDR